MVWTYRSSAGLAEGRLLTAVSPQVHDIFDTFLLPSKRALFLKDLIDPLVPWDSIMILSWYQDLFQTMLVFENYPAEETDAMPQAGSGEDH